MKIKMIDLLIKIANGEEVPKKIKFHGKYYTWYDNEHTGNKGYCLEPLRSDSNSFLEINTVYDLNNEVEILEEEKKIPEKISAWYEFDGTNDKVLMKIMLNELKDKYNEIIDYLKSKGE